MAIDRSRRLGAVRRNTLTACLAAALTACGANAAGAHSENTGQATARFDRALSDAVHAPWMSELSGFAPRNVRSSTSSAAPMRPASSTIVVENCADDGSEGSLRQAFAIAQDGDVIDMTGLATVCSVITLASGAISVDVPNLTVLGPGQDKLTIDGGNVSRVFQSKYYGLTISDVTIANGSTSTGFGGCIDITGGGDLILTRSTVTGCHAGDGNNTESRGGAVYVGRDLTMEWSTISASSATASNTVYGGGAYARRYAGLHNSSIEGNTATATASDARGGGLFAYGVTVTGGRVINNLLTSIEGNASGGGIHSSAGYSNSVLLIDSTLSGNKASANCGSCIVTGGGASAIGHISAYYSTINNNHVLSASASTGMAAGGGLATLDDGNDGVITLGNTTVSGNSSLGGENMGGLGFGGGIATIGDSVIFAANSTIAFNQASHVGGGATINGGESGDVNGIYSTIVAKNEAPVGEGNDIAPGSLISGFTLYGSNNLVMAASPSIMFQHPPITADPLLMPLTMANGGLTATHALAPTSQAINNGFLLPPTPEVDFYFTWDQRGCPYSREAGSAPDIGAFEVQMGTIDYIFGDGFDGELLCP